MHYALEARNARKLRQQAAHEARQAAERLFQPLHIREVAKIVYPVRFRSGEFAVAALLPIDRETVKRFRFICEAHRGYHYPPTIISGADGRRLRLMWRFPLIKPPSDSSEEKERAERYALLLHYAIVVMRWINDVFPHEAIVYSSSGIMDFKTRLQAFD